MQDNKSHFMGSIVRCVISITKGNALPLLCSSYFFIQLINWALNIGRGGGGGGKAREIR